MLLLGLTGSIATGKSTVSDLLRAPPYSLPIIDADVLARKVVEPGTPGYRKVVEYFSATTPDLLVSASECGGENGPDGKGRPLNRPALGRRVFGGGPEKEKDRKALGGIVHPAVRSEMYKMMLHYYLRGYWAVVLDVPLLFESGWERICGVVMVVAVSDPEVQIRRLRERDEHLSAEDAENRVKSQTDVRVKARQALYRGESAGAVIWNDGDRNTLKVELKNVMAQIQKKSPQWWAWLLLFVPPLAGLSGLYSFIRSSLIKRTWDQQQQREKAKL